MAKYYCKICQMNHNDIFSKKCPRIRQSLWKISKCPECEKEINKKELECPFCGCDFDTYKYREKHYIWI